MPKNLRPCSPLNSHYGWKHDRNLPLFLPYELDTQLQGNGRMTLITEVRFNTRINDTTRPLMRMVIVLMLASSVYIFLHGIEQTDVINRFGLYGLAALMCIATLATIFGLISANYKEYVLSPADICIKTIYPVSPRRNTSVCTPLTEYKKLLLNRQKFHSHQLSGWKIDLFLICKNGEQHRMRHDFVRHVDNSDIKQLAEQASAITGLRLETISQDCT